MKNSRKAISLYKKEMLRGKGAFSRAVDYIALRLIAFIACYMWFSTMVSNNAAKVLLSIGATGFISVSLDLINTLRLDRFIKVRRDTFREEAISHRLLTLTESECMDIIRKYIRSNPEKFEKRHIICTCMRAGELQSDDVFQAIRLSKKRGAPGAIIFHNGKLSSQARTAAATCSEASISFVSLRSALDKDMLQQLSPTDKEIDAALFAHHEEQKQRIKKAASAPLERVRIRRYIFAAACLTGLSFFVERALYYRLMAAVCICLGAIAWWLSTNSTAAN